MLNPARLITLALLAILAAVLAAGSKASSQGTPNCQGCVSTPPAPVFFYSLTQSSCDCDITILIEIDALDGVCVPNGQVCEQTEGCHWKVFADYISPCNVLIAGRVCGTVFGYTALPATAVPLQFHFVPGIIRDCGGSCRVRYGAVNADVSECTEIREYGLLLSCSTCQEV